MQKNASQQGQVHSRTQSLPVNKPSTIAETRPLRVAREFDMLLVRGTELL